MKNFTKLVFVLICAVNCNNETGTDYIIPETSFTIYLSSNDLLSIGNNSAKVIDNGGVMGLIVYKNSETNYLAFDRLCTNYPVDTSTVVLDVHNMIATCPKCKSTYQILLGGEVSKGPARFALKQYRCVLFDGRLEISN